MKENIIKEINFKGSTYSLSLFHYSSGRLGFMLVNKSESFNGTIDVPGVKIMDDHVIVKDYHFNVGLFECLVESGVVDRQAKPINIGLNVAYHCKLLANGS